MGPSDFILGNEQMVHLVGRRRKRPERWGRVHLWQLAELAKGRRSFWAVAILACVQSAVGLRRSECRDSDGWVRVTRRLLTYVDPPSPKAKRAALAELREAGILEVRRRGNHAPEVRLLGRPRADRREQEPEPGG